MNSAEVRFWLNGLFPTKVDYATVGGCAVGSTLLDGFPVAVTANVSRINTGLVSGERAVRSELLLVGDARFPQLTPLLLSRCAQILLIDAASYPAQPGTLIPHLTDLVVRAHPEWALTAKHGLFVEPTLWSNGIPQVHEEPGEVALFDDEQLNPTLLGVAHDQSALGRITLMLELVLITDDELEYAVTYSVKDLQSAMVSEGRQVRDWLRE